MSSQPIRQFRFSQPCELLRVRPHTCTFLSTRLSLASLLVAPFTEVGCIMLFSTTTEPDFAFLSFRSKRKFYPLRKSRLVAPFPFGEQLTTLPSLCSTARSTCSMHPTISDQTTLHHRAYPRRLTHVILPIQCQPS